MGTEGPGDDRRPPLPEQNPAHHHNHHNRLTFRLNVTWTGFDTQKEIHLVFCPDLNATTFPLKLLKNFNFTHLLPLLSLQAIISSEPYTKILPAKWVSTGLAEGKYCQRRGDTLPTLNRLPRVRPTGAGN